MTSNPPNKISFRKTIATSLPYYHKNCFIYIPILYLQFFFAGKKGPFLKKKYFQKKSAPRKVFLIHQSINGILPQSLSLMKSHSTEFSLCKCVGSQFACHWDICSPQKAHRISSPVFV